MVIAKWFIRNIPKVFHSNLLIDDLKKVRDSSLAPWTDLLDDPKQWTDYRDSKRDGQVNPRFPDFKRKDGNGALWLNNAPKWVLSRLEELKFDVPAVKSKQAKDFKGILHMKTFIHIILRIVILVIFGFSNLRFLLISIFFVL
ncbi:protein OSB2, chloroplastic [Arachis duranensis]|uniref:Protein OSB2, chloroplastic n=1 Tax=Arachis duranensis TaxID=130453 RepID=A0A6P4CKG0_ARADU|nr:protein OSB2, chloroplastic [Arachis duranensis]